MQPRVEITAYDKGKDLEYKVSVELMPDIEPVVAACEKGDVVLMSCFTPHRSTTNYSDLCRWSLDLRYQPTGVHTGRY